MFIGLASSENYHRRPRIITVKAWGGIQQGGTNPEGVLRDGLEGNFWEEGLPFCVQSKLECLHGCSGHNILWQLVPARDYSNAERMLAVTSLNTAVGESSKYDLEAQCGWGQQRPPFYLTRVGRRLMSCMFSLDGEAKLDIATNRL